MFFSFYSFGCKLNQLEGEAVINAFKRSGFSFLSWNKYHKAALLIINTCTVTSMAEQKARRLIRKALKELPSCCVIVTGCYAQLDEVALLKLQENESTQRLFVVSGDKKDLLLDLPLFILSEFSSFTLPPLPELSKAINTFFDNNSTSEEGSFRFKPEEFSLHSRAFLKIQDGCDRSCTYCRVSIARGKSRSLASAEILSELKNLEAKGINEAVFTGVNICQYNDNGKNLPGLLNYLLGATDKICLRLSSLEPEALDSYFFDVLKNPRIRPHFHLSLQSGSDTVLNRMGRPYTSLDVLNVVKELRSVKDDPFLACDIISGFPGEGESDFESTYSLCESVKFSWIHVFPFSPRPGTAAYAFNDRVAESEVKQRCERLKFLAQKGRRDYIESCKGREVEAIVESTDSDTKSDSALAFVPATSENYLKLLVRCEDKELPAPGSLVKCRISSNVESKTSKAFDAEALLL